jgi:methionyl-tRNA formyltransferase
VRCGFVTCVRLGLACMEEIDRAGGRLHLAVTLGDDLARGKSGRVHLDGFCAARNIPLAKVRHVNDAEVPAAVRRHRLDWLFIVGWSQIAGPEVLAAPRRGVLGMHPTLLPEGRGRASIPWAILKGLRETGVTLFQLDEGVDTGPIVAREVLPLAPDETATRLYERVTEAHVRLIGRVWPDLAADRLTATAQDESRATRWPGRRPADGEIRPGMTVAEAERLVRATTHPYPGAFWLEPDRVVRVWRGRPLDRGETPDPAAGPLFRLADGVYQGLEVGFEPSPASAGLGRRAGSPHP